MQRDQFENIPSQGMYSTDNQVEKIEAVVAQKKSGLFKFSLFAISQFIHGAMFMADDMIVSKKGIIMPEALILVCKLSIIAQTIPDKGESLIELDRNEVEILKQFLSVRMQHCEDERDMRSEKFNPDTYIGQKLLLLDIREWLMVEVISFNTGGQAPQQFGGSMNLS